MLDYFYYLPHALRHFNCKVLMEDLKNTIEWKDLSFNGQRKEALFNRTNHPYYFDKRGAIKPDYHQHEPLSLSLVWAAAERLAGCSFEACFVNLYMGTGGNIGWHKDNSPSIDLRRPVAVVTLGEKSVVNIRETSDTSASYGIEPEPGSMYMMMPGFQEKYEHMVPDLNTGAPRMSLVFRPLSGYVRVPA